MVDVVPAQAGAAAKNAPADEPSIIADGVHVTYRVFQDQRPTLRRMVANRFRPRPYRPLHAVQGVSIEAYPGDAVGIIGRNGSGKSTLLRALAGLLPVSQGAVYARSTPVLLGVSAALQQELSGRRNIFLGGTALGLSRSELEERFDDIVRFAGLEDFIDLPLRAYSSGMVARLQFSIATTIRPDILLIDEALAVGDAEFKKKSERRIGELLDTAGTIFLVSHSLGMIAEICTRAIWLDRGEVAAQGSPDEVLNAYQDAVDQPAKD